MAGWFDGDVAVEAPPVTGWWAELHYAFALAVTPTLDFSAGFARQLALTVTPALGMDAQPIHARSLDLAVSPAIQMGAPHPTGFGMTLTPAFGMAGEERYDKQFGLTLAPTLAMAGQESFKQQFDLTVAPTLDMTADQVHYDRTVNLTVTPSLSMAPQGFSDSAFALSVTATVGMTAEQRFTKTLPLTVTPSLGMVGEEHYDKTIGLTVTPTVGMAGREHYDRTVGMVVAPSMGFAAVGHDGVSNVPLAWQGANTSTTNTVTIPTHAIGDLILICSWNAGNFQTTPPTKPSAAGTVPAWVDIVANTGASNVSGIRIARFTATATNHTSGTWTGATIMMAIVIRGQNATTPIGGAAEADSGSFTGANSTTPAITLVNSTGSSMILSVHVAYAMTGTAPAAPSGYTRRASGSRILANTKNVTTSDGSYVQNVGGFDVQRAAQIEILD